MGSVISSKDNPALISCLELILRVLESDCRFISRVSLASDSVTGVFS